MRNFDKENTFYKKEYAQTIAKKLTQDDEDGWRYEAESANQYYARILVYDEENEYVGTF